MMKMINLLFATILVSIFAITNQAMSQTAANTYGPIKTGDMLWHIAVIVRPARSISRYQAMLALLKANPHAFHIPCNLNTLKVGKILYIPSGAEMQALSHAEAVNEFNRQYQQWKASREQRQPIVCPQPLAPPVAELEKPRQPVTKSASIPITRIPATHLPHSRNEVANPNQETTEPSEVANSNPETASPPLTPSIWENVLVWFSTPLSLPIMIAVLMTVLLFMAFVIGWRLQKYVVNQSVANKNQSPDAPVEKMPSSPANTSTIHKQHDEIGANNSVSATEMATAPVNQSSGMKEKLDNVRAYLAEDEAQITDKLLREVIQKGTPEQQAEARQLYEINKKMNSLEQNVGHKQPAAFSNATAYPIWQDVEQKGKHLPAQYLPENREKVFELIDKIFDLLDYELNAQGKLIEAYVNRHQQAFFNKSYEIVEKPEKVIVDDKTDNPLEKPRYEPNPPRRL